MGNTYKYTQIEKSASTNLMFFLLSSEKLSSKKIKFSLPIISALSFSSFSRIFSGSLWKKNKKLPEMDSAYIIICNQEWRNCILLPKLFRPTVRKNCSSDREKLLQNFWDHYNNSFKQWKIRTIFGNRMLF